MGNVIVSGLFGGGYDSCAPQLPKDGSVTKDAFLELTLEQALEYYWKSKTYTIDSFDLFVTTKITDPYNNAYGVFSLNGLNPSLSQDALCQPEASGIHIRCGGYDSPDYFTAFDEILAGTAEYNFTSVSSSTSGSELTTSGVATLGGDPANPPMNGYWNYTIGWRWFFSYCDYEVTPNLYYVLPLINVNTEAEYFGGNTYYSVVPVLNQGLIPNDAIQAGTFTLNFFSGSSSTCNLYHTTSNESYVSDTSCSCNASITVTSVF
jgi:hypothetical protein